MPLSSFLDRMIAPGPYLAIAFKSQTMRGMGHRFFPRANVDAAAKYLHWACDTAQMDTWFALASYNEAHPLIKQKGLYNGSRTQANAHALKCFWFDADISRPGDGKDPSRVFANTAEVVHWVKQFSTSTAIPLPNVWVRSGYGLHLYWVFEDALSRDDWQPYANALKAALLAHKAKGDSSVVADAARILRPIETFNYKDPAHPAPCHLEVTSPDYANANLLPLLHKMVGNYQAAATTLSGRPPSITTGSKPLTANATAGLNAAPRDLGTIALHCAQVRRSLDEGGASDGRQLWRGMLTLARFCVDGRDWAHRLGELHPAYDQAKTDAEVDLIETEHSNKNFGPTKCATFDAERPGLCGTCPHAAKVKTPWQLGLQAVALDPDALPSGWHRNSGWIVDYNDQEVLHGDMRDPVLERVGIGYRLSFTFEEPNSNHHVTSWATSSELNTKAVCPLLASRGIPLNTKSGKLIPVMLMGWVDKLIDECRIRPTLPSFGWHHGQGYDGFAVGGQFYRADGTDLPAFGLDDDRTISALYAPTGEMTRWRAAAQFIAADNPEIHTAIAVSFGAPLMGLSAEAGGCISFVGDSGVGKSTAFYAGSTVWGERIRTIMQLDDTENYRARYLSQTQAMPVYWDEARFATKDGVASLINILHKLTQGRDKGRLASDITARDTGHWRTLFALASNTSVTELIASQPGYAGAVLLRVLEIPVTRAIPPTAPGTMATLIHHLDTNYGLAGRVYAQWLATHQNEARIALAKAQAIFTDHLGLATKERFHITMAACIVAGAALARQLGLLDLDIRAIVAVLARAIRLSRLERDDRDPERAGTKLIDVFNAWLNDQADGLIRTPTIKGPGPTKRPLMGGGRSNHIMPVGGQNQKTPSIQIASQDKLLRFDLVKFNAWCNAKGHSQRRVLDTMHTDWGVGPVKQGTIGAGTNWCTVGQVRYVEIDLRHPDLAHVLELYGNDFTPATTGSGGSNIIPLHP